MMDPINVKNPFGKGGTGTGKAHVHNGYVFVRDPDTLQITSEHQLTPRQVARVMQAHQAFLKAEDPWLYDQLSR